MAAWGWKRKPSLRSLGLTKGFPLNNIKELNLGVLSRKASLREYVW